MVSGKLAVLVSQQTYKGIALLKVLRSLIMFDLVSNRYANVMSEVCTASQCYDMTTQPVGELLNLPRNLPSLGLLCQGHLFPTYSYYELL